MRRTDRCRWHFLMAVYFIFSPCHPVTWSPGQAQTDPLPLRRVVIPPERVPRELERARQGVLVQMPREEFEARVQRATQAGDGLKEPPRLAEARYRATLVDSALIGTGRWIIYHAAPVPGLLPITPLSLALRQARLDSGSAILGPLDGRTLALLVEQPGQHTLTLDWSARSEPGPDGLHFILRIPACALTSLELDLPGDHHVTVYRDACQLSGPHPAAAPDRRLWRIECAGRSQIDLVIRRLAHPGQPPPLVLAELTTTHVLEPDLVEADFDFRLEVLHNRVRELVCECDPSLRPIQVSLRNQEIEAWEVHAGTSAQAPSTLLIRLREPVQGALQFLRIRCQARLPADKSWTCPGVRLIGAVPRGETLVLRIPAHVRLENWQSGSFHLTAARTDPTGRQILTLTGSGFDESPREASSNSQPTTARARSSGRPRARVLLQGLEFRARQLAWWRIGPEKRTLTVQITYEVARGHLFQIPIQLPAGWEVEAVEEDQAPPRQRLRHWTVLPQDKGSVLLLDLERPLEASPPNRWAVQVHLGYTRNGEHGPASAARATASEPLILAFPEIIPQGARLREGVLALSIDPVYQASVQANLPATSADRLGEREVGERESEATGIRSLASPGRAPPWSGQAVDSFYAYRGEPLSGTLQLWHRQAQVRAQCTSKVVLASGRAAVLTRLALQPEAGSPETLDLYVSAPVVGAWQWKTEKGSNSVRAIQRLAAAEAAPHLRPLAASTALEALCLLAPERPQGTLWRLSLAQPLREPLVLEATLDLTGQQLPDDPVPQLLPLTGASPLEVLGLTAVAQEAPPWILGMHCWEVPLLTAATIERMEGEVTLHLAGADMVQLETSGLREVTTGLRSSAASPWRTFRYGQSPVRLVLRGQVAATDRSAEAVADQSQLHIYVEPSGRLLQQYRFALWNWRQRTLPVRLPRGAQPLAAQVDGQWLTRLAVAESVDEALLVELPVTGGGARLHHFEVVYVLDMPAWRLWTRLAVPAPILPVHSIACRRIWHLPPGLAPLAEGGYARLPGPGYGEREQTHAAHSDSFLTFPFALLPFRSDKWEDRQRQVLAEARQALRSHSRTKPGGTLRDALQVLAWEALQAEEPVVLDTVALHEAALGPEILLPFPGEAAAVESAAYPWEGLGLVYVPCRPAALLTTRRQLETWQDSTPGDPALPVSVEEALAEAAAQGHDRSGRFRAVADWLREKGGRTAPTDEHGAKNLPPLALLHLQSSLPWTQWEPLAGTGAADAFWVVRQEVVPGLALALAGLLGVVGWRVRHFAVRTRLELLLAWLTVGGLALVWLPAALRQLVWWPTLTAAALAAAWYLRTAIRFAAPPRPAGPGPATATGLALVLTLGLTARASAPDPFTVWLVPGPGDAARQLVLVAPELLDQLQTLAQRGALGLQGVVLLSAHYEGTVAQNTAEFQAEFRAHCFSDTAVLTLPLGGVRLQEARLDGTPAFPVALPVRRNGYSLTVQGRGPHTLRLRFTTRVVDSGEDRDLRFTIPEVVQSRLKLHVPPGARYLHVVPRLEGGAHEVQADATGLELTADLGRVVTLHVRWRQEADQPGPPLVQVQETYFWDLQSDGSRLLGLLHYTVQRGAPTTFTVRLPEDLEVHRVEPIKSRTGPPARLKNWLLGGTGAQRHVQLVFQSPITESVQIFLELVPRRPWGSTVSLLLPAPQDVQFGEGYLAYRVEGFEVRGISAAPHLDDLASAEFYRLWQAVDVEDPGPPERAYRFRRATLATPLVRLNVRPPAVCERCTQEITWRVGSRQADVQATAKLLAPEDDDLILVEWEVPPEVVLAEVSGTDIRAWSRSGSRVQIWFQRGLNETTVELSGWLPRPPEEPLAPFLLPCLRVLSTRAQTTFVHVASSSRLALQPENRRNLLPLPETQPSDQVWTYVSNALRYGGTFRVRPASASAGARCLTLAEVRDRSWTLVAFVEGMVRHGDPRTLTVRLHNWESSDIRLEAPPMARVRAPRRDRTGRGWVWVVDLPPGSIGTYQLKLTGNLPLEAVGEIAMPEVSIEGVEPVERWLAVAGTELAVDEARGVTAVADPAQVVRRWPAAKDRLPRASLAWKVETDDWRLRLRPRSALAASRPVQVFLVEQVVAVLDGQRWGHQATYWLYHEAGTDLNILLPTGATVLTVTVDGSDVTPLQPDRNRLWLPLTGGGGARLVRLNWTFDALGEPLPRPNLERPRLEGVADGTVLWRFHVPAGYRLEHHGGQVKPAQTAGQDLRRAAAQMQLSAVLAGQAQATTDERSREQLALAQERFYRYCRQAEYQLARLAPALADTGPEEQSLAAWLGELRAQNQQLAGLHQFEKLRARAENEMKASAFRTTAFQPENSGRESDTVAASLRSDLLPERGTPTHWWAPRQAPAPQLHLVAEQVHRTRQAWVHTVLLLVLLLHAWIASHYAQVVTWVWITWPEQVIALGLLGWQAFGASVVVVLLVWLGLCCRLFYLGRWLLGLRNTDPAVQPTE